MKKSKSFIELCNKLGVDPERIPEITSFEEACKDRKLDPKKLPIVEHLPSRDQKRSISDYKLGAIAHALRGGKDVSYFNNADPKYFPVFRIIADKKRPSGFGLSFLNVGDWRSLSSVGVRLLLPSYDLAEYFGKQFIDLHTDHHLLT